jgi:hypothetical protein
VRLEIEPSESGSMPGGRCTCLCARDDQAQKGENDHLHG